MPDRGDAELVIVPEPTSEERAAIEAALRSRAGQGGGRPGPWWEAGVRESVGAGDPTDSPVGSAAGLA